MPRPRKSLVCLGATPYYHCVTRCVRRTFLCGGEYEHRRAWIEDRLHLAAEIFAIDLCAYAIMSNHHHTVLHINPAKASRWTPRDICKRWHRLFKGTVLTQRFLKGETLEPAETAVVNATLDKWRLRLLDISWFMRCINEPIAREANKEDRCTGRFWEGRFSSQALLDDKALAACLAYVDLNPIRATMASTPETSDYTSIKARASAIEGDNPTQPKHLFPFVGDPCNATPAHSGLPFVLTEYLELVDATGRVIRDDKRGAIDPSLSPILSRLDIDIEQWLYLTKHFESRFKGLVGSYYSVRKAFKQFGYKRSPGAQPYKEAFG